jgi:glycosyltransferase involved in cell wall biosynthesis
VVSSAVQENVRFFRHGETGMLCSSVEEFAESAGALLTDPERRQKMTEGAFEDFRARLSVEAAARAVDGVLRGVIGGRKLA